MGLFSFLSPGSSAMNTAANGLANYANTESGIYQQYGAPALAAMYQQYTNPVNSPSQNAALNDFNASTGAQTNGAAGQLQQNLVSRGLGGSSIMGNSLSSLYGNQVNVEAQNQQANNAYNQQRSQAALSSILGYGMNAENSLPNAYGQMFNMGQSQNQSAMGGLGSLASLGGYFLNSGGGGNAASATTGANPSMNAGTWASNAITDPSMTYGGGAYPSMASPAFGSLSGGY